MKNENTIFKANPLMRIITPDLESAVSETEYERKRNPGLNVLDVTVVLVAGQGMSNADKERFKLGKVYSDMPERDLEWMAGIQQAIKEVCPPGVIYYDADACNELVNKLNDLIYTMKNERDVKVEGGIAERFKEKDADWRKKIQEILDSASGYPELEEMMKGLLEEK